MIGKDGYRPNVAMVIANHENKVFWGRRIRRDSWQFPQGGIRQGETALMAMHRELKEEVGLEARHVQVLGRTRSWLRYDVPEGWVRRDMRGIYRGQKQIWFLLRFLGRDQDICLKASSHPEFDAWRWADYWVPLDVVVEFKHEVYTKALAELFPYLQEKRRKAFLPKGARRPGRTPGGNVAQPRPVGASAQTVADAEEQNPWPIKKPL